MPDRSFADGDVRVTFTQSLDVREATRNRSLLPEGVDATTIENLLGEGGFELAGPPLTIRRKRTRATAGASGSETAAVEVRLRGDERAVLLTERGGYLSWHVPVSRTRSLADGESIAKFTLAVRPPDGAQASRGLVDDIRTFVLKFIAPVAATAMKVFERRVEQGLVHITSSDRSDSWRRLSSLSDLELPDQARILLLVHGTFSSTEGGFGSLTKTADGVKFLGMALESGVPYDAVIGFDHWTLSVDPRANAEDLLHRLSQSRAEGLMVDVICHSRGGLVVRSLVEQVLPESNSSWSGAINNVVFVGVPNGGTNLAEPGRWSTLVDVYTNVLLESIPPGDRSLAGAIAKCAVRNVGAAVKYLAAYGAEPKGVPGLAAMRPDGDFIRKLNERQDKPTGKQPWLVISTDFHATAEQRKLRTIEAIVDGILDEANDLVVDTKYMSAIDPPGTLVVTPRDLGTTSAIFHTNYFSQSEVVNIIRSRLFPTAAPPPHPPPPPIHPDEGFHADLDFGRDVHFRVNGGGRGPTPALPPVAPARRTRAHILAEMPGNVVVRRPATVRVMLSRNRIKVSAGAVSGEQAIVVTEDEALTVHVVPKKNCTVKGKDTARFRLPLDEGLSELPFVVKPSSEGAVEVRVVVSRAPGEVVASVILEAHAHEADDAAHRVEVVRKQVEAAALTSIDLKDAVRLEISELEKPGYVQFQYRLTLPGEAEPQTYLSGRLRDRASFVANLFRTIEENWTEFGDKPKEFMKTLQEQGSDLFEQLFPLALREKLWSIRNDVKSFLILADEPYFPWELVHLQPPGLPLQRKPRFLGQYGLVRWQIVPFPEKPALRRRRGRVYSICPDYVDPALDLPGIAREAKFLKRKLGAKAVTATSTGVREILRNSEVDILHFSGHGFAKPLDVGDAKILLTGRDTGKRFALEYISAKTVKARANLKAADGTGPLVVLNACQVGISGVELSTLGGFARAFLERGAQAFVSCLWSVKEEPSRVFVETLYTRLLAGDSIGKAAVTARTAAHTPEDPATWLGFVIYARPDAKFVRR